MNKKSILIIDTPENFRCPLKPLPQYKLTDLEKTTDYSCGWEQGWNSCLAEILKEGEQDEQPC